ncbi:hypothetical protein TraAM80_07296 [Trypanosoma rangeli]|uniref:Uncharacterized protein n=1 Tax=Trypanosoma rangeli TaxID=5698 RepID=A0A422N685_TRYRA|nr:uncharacterized protein TraAM80_07296 [Trypanosoma rangeli]RNF00959.1 hypothetical protein TraAM80_07296 [Trypanosoma rangeli]|eukprot:RNF00959.1 hypothetical protein TraAM80_07296 [Trypanosoma rangeli]
MSVESELWCKLNSPLDDGVAERNSCEWEATGSSSDEGAKQSQLQMQLEDFKGKIQLLHNENEKLAQDLETLKEQLKEEQGEHCEREAALQKDTEKLAQDLETLKEQLKEEQDEHCDGETSLQELSE